MLVLTNIHWVQGLEWKYFKYGFITYKLQAVSYAMQVTFYKLKNNFMSWKFILRVGSKSTSCKLMFYELKLYNDNFCMF